jgi:hypothetical protein
MRARTNTLLDHAATRCETKMHSIWLRGFVPLISNTEEYMRCRRRGCHICVIINTGIMRPAEIWGKCAQGTPPPLSHPHLSWREAKTKQWGRVKSQGTSPLQHTEAWDWLTDLFPCYVSRHSFGTDKKPLLSTTRSLKECKRRQISYYQLLVKYPLFHWPTPCYSQVNT